MTDDLKRALAREHSEDAEAYMDGKAPFIEEAEGRALAWRPAARSIVLFDFGDVIAAFDPSFRAVEFARLTALSPERVLSRLSTNDFWIQTDRGAYSGPEMERRICELLGRELPHEELLRLQAAAFTVRPEMVEIARAVSRRLRTGILTNNAPLLHEAFPVHFPELTRLFEPLLFSFQFGHVKPERELFERVQRRLGTAPGSILFIDDNSGHVAAARSVGWDAVQFRSPPQIRGALAERGLLEP
jgi:HAD superfamily hydrolase (TIGR01509 family)